MLFENTDHRRGVKEIYNFESWSRPDTDVVRDLPLFEAQIAPLPFVERIAIADGYQDSFADGDGHHILLKVQQFDSVIRAHEAIIDYVIMSMSPRLPLGREVGLDVGDISVTGHTDTHLAIIFTRDNILISVESVGAEAMPVDDFANDLDAIVSNTD